MDSLINPNAIALCLQYSDDAARLEKWLASNQVMATAPRLAPCPWGNDTWHLSSYISINGGPVFQFWHSANDTATMAHGTLRKKQQFHDGRLYAVLCCIKCDLGCDTSSFESFCADLGYNLDSIADRATYEAMCNQKRILLQSGLTHDVVSSCFPA
jgi:hypothetical protein